MISNVFYSVSFNFLYMRPQYIDEKAFDEHSSKLSQFTTMSMSTHKITTNINKYLKNKEWQFNKEWHFSTV